MPHREKILFVCHGNICRSPMAEMMLKKMALDKGLEGQLEIASAATSTEEIGNDIYPPAKACLRRHGIPFTPRSARQMTEEDYHYYDRIYVMDHNNLRYLHWHMPHIVRDYGRQHYADSQGKIQRLMELTSHSRDVADPWYTGDFEQTYDDIFQALQQLCRQLEEND